MSDRIEAIALSSAGVRLEPLTQAHGAALRKAAEDPDIWTHMPYEALGDGFDLWLDSSIAASGGGREAVWAVLADGAPVGSTRFLAIEPAHKRLEIGATWYAPSAWGTKVNPACKLALMRFAFEELGFNRVEFKTDIKNTRSQAAIAKLGAVREGVFRAHMIRPDGTLRDSVYFSVIASEWPGVRERLSARLFERA